MKSRVIVILTSMLLSMIVAFDVELVIASEPYVVPPGYEIETFATGLDGPFGMVFDSDGNLYVANEGVEPQGTYPGTTVSKITPEGMVSVYASSFMGPSGLAIDPNDNLYVSDDTNRIIKVAPNGETSVFAIDLGNPNVLAFD